MASKWSCQFAEDVNAVTVGQVMTLACDGEGVTLDPATTRLVAVSQPEHTVKLIKAEIENTKAQIQFVSYRVGEHKDVSLVLTDDKNFLEANPVSWTVKSVIDPQNPEAMKPFDSYGPWRISWPIWYFVVLAILIVAIGFSLYRSVQIYLKNKKLKADVEEYRRKHIPFDQLQKDLRAQQRSISRATAETAQEQLKKWLMDLQRSSLLYIKMEFATETEGLSPRKIVRKLRKKYPKASEARLNDLFLYLTELQNMSSKTLSPDDLDQALNWAQKTSDHVSEYEFGVKR